MKKVLMLVLIASAFLALGLVPQSAMAQGTISGTITNADNEAVVGAMVMVQGLDMRRGHRPFMARGESGEGGGYEITGVPAGRYIVSAMAREFGSARAEAGVEDGGVTDVDLQLAGRGGRGGGGHGGGDDEERPMGSLIGHVVDAAGEGVGPARVVLIPARMMARGHRARQINVETDVNGNFEVAELPAGQWVVTAGIRGVGMGRARVAVEADAQADVTVTLRGR